MMVGTLCRSYKEAQTYVSFLVFLPMLVLTRGLFLPDFELWHCAVPWLGQHILLTGMIGGARFALTEFLIATATTTVAACVFLWLATRLFRKEKIVFGQVSESALFPRG